MAHFKVILALVLIGVATVLSKVSLTFSFHFHLVQKQEHLIVNNIFRHFISYIRFFRYFFRRHIGKRYEPKSLVCNHIWAVNATLDTLHTSIFGTQHWTVTDRMKERPCFRLKLNEN